MAERENTYWWHVGRLKIIDTYMNLALPDKNMKRTILNVGCGTGGTLPVLEKYGAVKNVDVSSDAIKYMRQLGYEVDKVKGIKLPYKDNTFDCVAAFDVLEHIDDDVDALREWKRVLKQNGRIVLTVPAHQWLWSEHDVSLHHFRRYTQKTIREKVPSAELRPVKLSYAIAFSLPLIVGFRFLNKLLGRRVDSETSYVDVPNRLNSLFSNFLFLEAKFHRFASIPFGTSVIVILEHNSKNDA